MKSSGVFTLWMAAIIAAVSHGFSSSKYHTTTRPMTQTTTSTEMSTKQAEYGNETPLPDTYAQCGRCQSAFAVTEEDFGTNGRGRRLECSVCGHSWFQSKDRIMKLSDGFEMVTLPESDLKRIKTNIEEGKPPKFMGECKLYVGNIAFGCTEADIRSLFEEVGEVGDVALVRDDLGRNRGFGFVTMRTKEDGQKCMDDLDGKELEGRNLAVRESNS